MSAINYYPRWYYPISVTQFSEDDSHIAWKSDGNFVYIKGRDSFQTNTIAPLRHIPLSFSQSVRNKTWFLYCRFSLNREPGTVTGLEVQLSIDRGGRVVDDTVQLYKNSEKIGENYASMDLSTLKKYGNTWGLEWNNPYILTSGDFGVLLRFQSNFTIPHSTTPSIDFIRMRYTVANELLVNKQEARPNIGWTNSSVDDSNFSRDGKEGEGKGGKKKNDGFAGSNGSTGSNGFFGSNGFEGSYGFEGSGFNGSNGFIGSISPIDIGQIEVVFLDNVPYLRVRNSQNQETFIQIIPTNNLPLGGTFLYQSWLVGSLVYYWNGTIWVSIPLSQ
jgi:hypothetical protein